MSELDNVIDQIESHAALAREQKLRAELDDLKSANALLRGLISNRDAEIEQLWAELWQEVDERNKMRADNVRLRERLKGSDMLAHVRGEQIERLRARAVKLESHIVNEGLWDKFVEKFGDEEDIRALLEGK